MLESSYGLTFFLKSPKRKSDQIRYVYVRITVDGIPKETSVKKRWVTSRWDQKTERAIGTKEDAKELNFYLDSLLTKIGHFRTELINSNQTITAQRIIDFVKGDTVSKAKVLEEFLKHNEEMEALVPKEFSKGTLTKYMTTFSHVKQFIKFKYKREDLEFRELNFEFVSDFEFFLKTAKGIGINTTSKYISNFKKIVLRAVAKEIIAKDPFALYKGKKVKVEKKPLTKAELRTLEKKEFSTDRLSLVRDVSVFQCYTGLAYIDVRQLKRSNIKEGDDGKLWIMSNRQKTKSTTDIPLLPPALKIMEKYKDHPICKEKGLVLPVISNQKMNEYLKEIQILCEISFPPLNTHRFRRTFASTVTLNNGVPIHVVKEMLGHHSIRQTEAYAITEQQTIDREMKGLEERLSINREPKEKIDIMEFFKSFERELNELKVKKDSPQEVDSYIGKIAELEEKLMKMKGQVLSTV